ncbi:MAG: NUDIX domain-containing protein, partial [Thermoplasmata archaeon]|nr:NUDIX domain-containing protein [Thermoplasmata archaeon]
MSDPPAISQECVEAYLVVRRPLQLLILKRPPSRGSFWVPVSGKVEPSDPDLRSALVREVAEETGFDRLGSVTDLDWAVTFPGIDGGTWRLHAFAVEIDAPRVPRLSEEHEAYEWLPFESASARLHYEDNRAVVSRLTERWNCSAP